MTPVTPETGLRWAALLYAFVSIVIGLLVISQGFGDMLRMAVGALVILQGWALLGFFSVVADMARNTAAIAQAVLDEQG